MTGLVWLKHADCFGERTWEEALADCNGLSAGWCGLTDGSNPGDWRLPNYKEQVSLVDAENYNPALPSGHPFTGVQPSFYWSSTTNTYYKDSAWQVGAYNGGVYSSPKNSGGYVWPVRGGH